MNFLKKLFGIYTENQEILFVQHYVNHAWGNQNEGSFVTSAGNIYVFKFKKIFVSDFEKELDNIMKKKKPTRTCDKCEILRAKNMLESIDEDSEMIYTGSACDAGQDTLSFYHNNKFITLATTGDSTGFVNHDKIIEILSILQKIHLYRWERFDLRSSIEDLI